MKLDRVSLGSKRALAAAVSLIVMLAASGTQAVPMVLFEDAADPNKATGILNLEVAGADPRGYNVAFDQAAFANEIYGDFPGDLVQLPEFFTFEGTSAAADAVNAALNTAPRLVETIGEVGAPGAPGHNIGVVTFVINPPLVEPVESIAVIRSAVEGTDWVNLNENFLTYNFDERPWAVFTVVPEPGTALLMGLGVLGLGVAGRRPRAHRRGSA